MEHGADIDKPCRHNCYPLAYAAYVDFESALYLLESGADYKLAECRGMSFLAHIRQLGEWREKEEHQFQHDVFCKKFDAVRAWLEKRGVDVSGK